MRGSTRFSTCKPSFSIFKSPCLYSSLTRFFNDAGISDDRIELSLYTKTIFEVLVSCAAVNERHKDFFSLFFYTFLHQEYVRIFPNDTNTIKYDQKGDGKLEVEVKETRPNFSSDNE